MRRLGWTVFLLSSSKLSSLDEIVLAGFIHSGMISPTRSFASQGKGPGRMGERIGRQENMPLLWNKELGLRVGGLGPRSCEHGLAGQDMLLCSKVFSMRRMLHFLVPTVTVPEYATLLDPYAEAIVNFHIGTLVSTWESDDNLKN